MPNVILFEGSSKTVQIPGSTEDFTIRLVVDNGNDGSIADQTWTAKDFVSAELTSGTYALRWPPATYTGFTVQTDANGKVIRAGLGNLNGGSDNFATSAPNGGHVNAVSNNSFIRDTQMRENAHSDITNRSLRGEDPNHTGWSVATPAATKKTSYSQAVLEDKPLAYRPLAEASGAIQVTKEMLQQKYSWKETGGASRRAIETDARLFNRHEGFEVVPMIQEVVNHVGYRTEADVQRVEALIKGELPGKVRGWKKVFDWLVARLPAASTPEPVAEKSTAPEKMTITTTLPKPALALRGTEAYQVAGRAFTRYELTVTNFSAYPDELFAPSPDLPPCGLNTSAARTWVDIFNGSNDARIYGFCALGQAADLAQIWFAVEVGQEAPESVYIKMHDRRLDTYYNSDPIAITTRKPPVQLNEASTVMLSIERLSDTEAMLTAAGTFTSPTPAQRGARVYLLAPFAQIADGVATLSDNTLATPRASTLTGADTFAGTFRANGQVVKVLRLVFNVNNVEGDTISGKARLALPPGNLLSAVGSQGEVWYGSDNNANLLTRAGRWEIVTAATVTTPPPSVITWNGTGTPSQVGARGSVTLTKTPNGTSYDVTLEGKLSISSPTYGYVRHGLPPGFLPISTDPLAYTCSIQQHATKGDTSRVGGNGVHIRNDNFSGYEGRATLFFPEKFYNGEFTLRCTWQTNEATDPSAWQSFPGIKVIQ